MIEFPAARIEKVKKYLAATSRYEDEVRFESVHRTLSQSLKVHHSQIAAAQYIGAIGYLFTGEPEEFDHLDAVSGMEVAARIFHRGERKTLSRSLLFDHAFQVLNVVPASEDRGYVDFESAHLTLLGGELLFGRIVEALVTPYVEPPNGAMSFAQATFRDCSFWMTNTAIERAIRKARHWPDWDTAAMRNR